MQIKKHQLESDMEQQTGSKLEKQYDKAVYYHPAYLTSMHSTSCKMLGCMDQAGIKVARRNINNFRYANISVMAESKEELKSLLMRLKEESEKLP